VSIPYIFLHLCRRTGRNFPSSKEGYNFFRAKKILFSIFDSKNCPLANCPEQTPESLLLFQWIGYANSLANPIIYTVFQKDLKTAVVDALKPSCCV
jgi:hypothetical protein